MGDFPGIYLIIEFSWPDSISPEQAQTAYRLHEITQDKDWIKEAVAASGGIGDGLPSTWIFWLENYAALDRLLHAEDDEVSQAYTKFFSQMPQVTEKVREKVKFA